LLMIDTLYLYYRNSSVDQAQKQTEVNQENHIKEWLKDLPVVIAGEFADAGKSGADATREQYNNMLATLDKVSGIAVYDIDRLTRDFDIGMDLIMRLRKDNKKLYVSRQKRIYDLHNFTDLFFHVNMVMMADEERKKINQRRIEGMDRYKKEHGGKWPHRPVKRIDWTEYDKMREAGVSKAAIARMMNIDQSTLHRRLKKRQKNI
jgi:DNA invertase Pin-like site-specific DNA recombinase